MHELSYDLAPVEIPVTIGTKKYILREASEDAARQWRNAATGAARFSQDGKAFSVVNVADSQGLLVSLCLCEVGEDGRIKTRSNGDVISVCKSFVGALPAKVVKDLFERVKAISDLSETGSAERKALLAAFRRDDAPIQLSALREWVERADADEGENDMYKPFLRLLKDDAEGAPKNGRAPTRATSS